MKMIMVNLATNVLGPNTQTMKPCRVILMKMVNVILALVFVGNIMRNMIG